MIYDGSLLQAAELGLASPWVNFVITPFYDSNGTSDDVINF